MGKPRANGKVADRKLGDEWSDWDGSTPAESSETNYGLFVWLAALATLALILIAGLFLWLIYPRLALMGSLLPTLFSISFLLFSAILILWMSLFGWSAATRRPVARWVSAPRLINRLLTVVEALGKTLGVSTDRLTNSFLKTHNVMVGFNPPRITADRLLILAPRCLTRENNVTLRQLKETYQFRMATVGGGSQARAQIRETRPEIVIAIACERDLLSGFKEVNPHVPVICFPNLRPEGPCKNTRIDLATIEETIKRCLISASGEGHEIG